jgi:hypothetical protein
LSKEVVSDLRSAIQQNDTAKAWNCYYALTNRRLEANPVANPHKNQRKLFRKPLPPSHKDECPLSHKDHGQVLCMVKGLLRPKTAQRQQIQLPPYVIVTRVEHVLKTMFQLNIPLALHEFHAVIDMYARTGQVGRVEFWLQSLFEQQPGNLDVKIANSVLAAYINGFRFEQALQWYDSYESKLNLIPNEFTYGQLFRLFAHQRNGIATDRLWESIINPELNAEMKNRAVSIAKLMENEKDNKICEVEEGHRNAQNNFSDHSNVNKEERSNFDFKSSYKMDSNQPIIDFNPFLDLIRGMDRPEDLDPRTPSKELFPIVILAYGRGGLPYHALHVAYTFLMTHAVYDESKTTVKVLDAAVQVICMTRHGIEAAEQVMGLYHTLGAGSQPPGKKAFGAVLLAHLRENEITDAYTKTLSLLTLHMHARQISTHQKARPLTLSAWVDPNRIPDSASHFIGISNKVVGINAQDPLEQSEKVPEPPARLPEISFPGIYKLLATLHHNNLREMYDHLRDVLKQHFPELKPKKVWQRKLRAA